MVISLLAGHIVQTPRIPKVNGNSTSRDPTEFRMELDKLDLKQKSYAILTKDHMFLMSPCFSAMALTDKSWSE